MRTAVVIGSTGLIGKILTQKLAHSGGWSNVLAITRKPVNWSHPKIRSLTFDFRNWNDLDLQIKSFAGQTGLDFFCTLGTTISKAGSKEKFKEIDYKAVVEFALSAKRCKAEQLFIVSAAGADINSSVFYNQVKGQMEAAVLSEFSKSIYFLRPSLLLGNREEFRLGERLAVLAAPIYSSLLVGSLKKYRPIQALDVAEAMIAVASKKLSSEQIIENDQILKLANSSKSIR